MAVGQRIEQRRADWYNVRRGELVNHKTGEVAGFLSGIIKGVRIIRSDKYGHLEIHVKLFDPDDGEEGQTYILSGNLTNQDGSVQTWARMLLARLANPDNEFGEDEKAVIEIYPIETQFGVASCCRLLRDSDHENQLFGLDVERDDLDTIGRCIDRVVDRYRWPSRTPLPALSEPDSPDRAALPEGSGEIEEAEIIDERPAREQKISMPPGAAQLYGVPASPTDDIPPIQEDDLPF